MCTDPSGPCRKTFKGSFRYLMLEHFGEGGQTLQEYRTDANGNAIEYGRLEHIRFLTYGFASAALHFLPQNQAACRFRYFGWETLDGRKAEVVGFAQIPQRDASTTVFQVGSERAHLLRQGFAWIDAVSFEILRMQADLLTPRPEIGLERLTTKVDFGAVHLPSTSATLRLPTSVIVDARISGQHLRNIHEYSHFKLFRVQSRIGPTPES
jgi:hypothetical protein